MSAVKEPLFHVVKRDKMSFAHGMAVRLCAVVLALLVSAVIIVLLTGMNPLSVYSALWDGAVGTSRRMWITLRDAAILAAWYSKGQRSSMVPIDYTLRRYVKKPSGSKPGFVIYTNQKTLYVTPEENTKEGE